MSSYSEQAFFDGNHCAHMADHEQELLRRRRKANALKAYKAGWTRFSPATLAKGQPGNPVHDMHAKLAMGWRFV